MTTLPYDADAQLPTRPPWPQSLPESARPSERASHGRAHARAQSHPLRRSHPTCTRGPQATGVDLHHTPSHIGPRLASDCHGARSRTQVRTQNTEGESRQHTHRSFAVIATNARKVINPLLVLPRTLELKVPRPPVVEDILRQCIQVRDGEANFLVQQGAAARVLQTG
ncbi:hypothetical protein OH76DRAFT_490409 [Lentinus brumalis]|uniref:Uncharacterized protein n=1 Tax=Lentinus brumalis TaxID=2498619 RepID=A0A371DBE2_9APHY|nr:hypothetical protein OH76DRAFT_490409 [Polyporus brumalis]